ncbi:UPF0262 family protein [Roseibium album]|uniref:UPF0262 protein LA5096_03708 n=1 Tax=Roseibium album TaxID=311410 RepID=A0A0M7AG32_9HYPH|nr:UPF0262 family protein [Roseibium album]MBG6155349.1 uncharacterized protein (UPF0262 family) [Labrenzia sp. EL_162]MBG6192522.1 uncharacterized protein (UPF0262 family) [Labrenzia sp. EL_159]CTQ60626.1 hypothetical protein LA5094_03402 [Roseibium album]CTQ65484.1 hypothetical protein LA5095_00568 [Roseibium album]CTQ73561.1 hypothetical protein LA5096_03708 [Roseibium album]
MSDTQPETNSQSAGSRLVDIVLDEASIARSTPEVEHDRAVAIYDLIEENSFQPVGHPPAKYVLDLAVVEKKLVFRIRTDDEREVVTHVLSLSPLRKIVKDYDLICESYYEAIRHATPSQIEAIDMGRRGVHNEGSVILMERLEGKIAVDMQTARRLFTLVYALHWKG